MNIVNIALSSSSAGETYMLDELFFTDTTQLTVDVYNVETRDDPPLYLNIEWGDGSDNIVVGCDFSATLITSDDITSITQAENIQSYDILLRKYNHIYHPSEAALTRKLSCYISIDHLIQNVSTKFILPIKIVSPSYYTKISDISLLQTNIIPDNIVLYTFGADNNSSIFETALDMGSLN